MRRLIYVPIIHAAADLGSIAEDVAKRGIKGFGEEFWQEHRKAVSGFWDAIADYFIDLEVNGFKVYQDGLVAGGEVGERIIEEGLRTGSKNYEIIDNLIKKGAKLVQTEDFPLVKKERDRIVKITQAKTIPRKIMAYLGYKLTKNKLLKKRDEYVAKRIKETLNHGETGILFMGAYHNILPEISGKFQVIEVKDVKKVRDYQRLLLHRSRNKEEFEKLTRYLTAMI